MTCGVPLGEHEVPEHFRKTVRVEGPELRERLAELRDLAAFVS
jgi:hypothetical protein